MKRPGRRIKEAYRKIMTQAGYISVTTAIPAPRMEAVITALCNRLCPTEPQRAYDYAYDQVARACAGAKYRGYKLSAFKHDGPLLTEELERVTGRCNVCGRVCDPEHNDTCRQCASEPRGLSQSMTQSHNLTSEQQHNKQ